MTSANMCGSEEVAEKGLEHFFDLGLKIGSPCVSRDFEHAMENHQTSQFSSRILSFSNVADLGLKKQLSLLGYASGQAGGYSPYFPFKPPVLKSVGWACHPCTRCARTPVMLLGVL